MFVVSFAPSGVPGSHFWPHLQDQNYLWPANMQPTVCLRAIGMCRVGSRSGAATECHALERQGRVGCARVWAYPAGTAGSSAERAMSCVLNTTGTRIFHRRRQLGDHGRPLASGPRLLPARARSRRRCGSHRDLPGDSSKPGQWLSRKGEHSPGASAVCSALPADYERNGRPASSRWRRADCPVMLPRIHH